ncbi:MAG: DUF5060 domain-containing protein, partial [Sedimentisphaerales bacterium]|nr:DUF5060 domain-containing protein [Sedimentisphaerales bacterium]
MRSAVCYLGLALLILAGGERFNCRCSGQEPLTLKTSAERIGQYDRIEFFLSLETPYRNPYDPQEIDVSVRIEDPRGQVLRLPGFFLQEYEQRILPEGDGDLWLYPRGRGAWRARFA